MGLKAVDDMIETKVHMVETKDLYIQLTTFTHTKKSIF